MATASHTSTSLRWRSRVAQAHAASMSHDEDDDDNNSKVLYTTRNHTGTSSSAILHRRCSKLISILLAGTTLTAASIWSLLRNNKETYNYYYPSWLVTITVTSQVAVAVIIMWQAYCQTSAPSSIRQWRQQLARYRRQRTVLQDTQQALQRKIQSLQPQLRQVHILRQDVGIWLSDTTWSIDDCVQRVHEQQTVYQSLTQCLRRELLCKLVVAVLEHRQQNNNKVVTTDLTVLTPTERTALQQVIDTTPWVDQALPHWDDDDDDVLIRTLNDVLRLVLDEPARTARQQALRHVLQWHPERLLLLEMAQ